LQLSCEEKFKALTTHILDLLCDNDGSSVGVPLVRLQALFTRKYGRPLTPLDYDCDSIESLVNKLSNAVQVSYAKKFTYRKNKNANLKNCIQNMLINKFSNGV